MAKFKHNLIHVKSGCAQLCCSVETETILVPFSFSEPVSIFQISPFWHCLQMSLRRFGGPFFFLFKQSHFSKGMPFVCKR